MTDMTINYSQIVTQLTDVRAAEALPSGIYVGDLFGGRSFTDNVAAVLERRSAGGWQELATSSEHWTLIYLSS